MASADEIRLTVESYTGATNAIKRAAIFVHWQKAAAAARSGATSLSIPGLNGSVRIDNIEAHQQLLMECLNYLDGIIGDNPGLSSMEPLGHTIDFSKRRIMD